jgi:hypothetical protein
MIMKNLLSMSRPSGRPTACLCGGKWGRRAAFGVGAALAASVLDGAPQAATGSYEALLVNCIDPRFVAPSARYMNGGGLEGRYSHFVIAGGPIAAVEPRFAAWHQAFWDNLGVTVDLHRIRRIVALAHRDCGAARLAFGDAALAAPRAEAAAHRESFRSFVAQVGRRHPSLVVEGGLMALGGEVEAFL